MNSGDFDAENEQQPKKPPVPAPKPRFSPQSPPPSSEKAEAEDGGEQQRKSLSQKGLDEYSACRFRVDINVSTSNEGPCPRGDYEVLMELTAKDGQKRVLSMDARMLAFLHEQLEKVEQAFPRCYVYKTQPSD